MRFVRLNLYRNEIYSLVGILFVAKKNMLLLYLYILTSFEIELSFSNLARYILSSFKSETLDRNYIIPWNNHEINNRILYMLSCLILIINYLTILNDDLNLLKNHLSREFLQFYSIIIAIKSIKLAKVEEKSLFFVDSFYTNSL